MQNGSKKVELEVLKKAEDVATVSSWSMRPKGRGIGGGITRKNLPEPQSKKNERQGV